jgi:hypothetical protein
MANIINGDNGVVSGSAGLKESADSSGVLALQTNGTTAVTVDTGQRTTFPTTIAIGNATPSTSGSGITFPATQSASSDANTLDDYEEGTWTPVATSNAGSITTYSVTASYVKIGRIVNCTFTVTVTNIGTASSFMNISGFPFSSITPASGFNTATGTCRENALTGTLYQFYLTTGSSSGTAQTTAGGAVTWGNNMSMNFNITYLTTS